jgi:hypothetical protein
MTFRLPTKFEPGFELVTGTALDLAFGNPDWTSQNGIVAKAGGSRNLATQLNAVVNRIDICATSGDSVKLPAVLPGKVIVVFNEGVADCTVFAFENTTTIDGSTSGFTINSGSSIIFISANVGQWNSFSGSGGSSAGITIDSTPITGGTNKKVLFDNNGFIGEEWLNSTVFNVLNYGAVGNGVHDDTTAINLAIAALNTAGKGVLYFPAGTYLVTAALTPLTANCIIKGDGLGGGNVGATLLNLGITGAPTLINCSSASAVLFTINSVSCFFRDLAIKNTSISTPTSSSVGILVTSSTLSQRCDYDHLAINGFYLNIDVQVGNVWSMSNCIVSGPVKNGIRIQNLVNGDYGDWSIINTNFYGDNDRASDTGILILSSGGGRILSCKWNGTPAGGIELNSSASILLYINNCSIENFGNSNNGGYGIKCTGPWGGLWIVNTEINPGTFKCNTGISLTSISSVFLDNLLFSNHGTTGISFTSCSSIQMSNITDAGTFDTFVSGLPAPSNSTGSNTPSIMGTITGNGLGVIYQLCTSLDNGTTPSGNPGSGGSFCFDAEGTVEVCIDCNHATGKACLSYAASTLIYWQEYMDAATKTYRLERCAFATPNENVLTISNTSGGNFTINNANLVTRNIATLAPVTLTGTSGTVTSAQSSIIFNPSGGFTVTLPAAASFSGMWLDLKLIAAQTVSSATSNVVPLADGAAGTAIFSASAGKWARLQSDGTNWIIMAAN